MTDEADNAAIRTRMLQPMAREQIVANELSGYLDSPDGYPNLGTWTHDDWLRLAQHVIQTVEIASDFTPEDMARALTGW